MSTAHRDGGHWPPLLLPRRAEPTAARTARARARIARPQENRHRAPCKMALQRRRWQALDEWPPTMAAYKRTTRTEPPTDYGTQRARARKQQQRLLKKNTEKAHKTRHKPADTAGRQRRRARKARACVYAQEPIRPRTAQRANDTTHLDAAPCKLIATARQNATRPHAARTAAAAMRGTTDQNRARRAHATSTQRQPTAPPRTTEPTGKRLRFITPLRAATERHRPTTATHTRQPRYTTT